MKINKQLVALAIVLVPAFASAHHGSGISYDTGNLWTTWATVKTFNYKNPHPTMTFTRTTKDGKVEEWISELLTAPALLARAGWSKGRSAEVLKPGTRVKLYVGTARVGGLSAIVMRLENEKGEELLVGVGGAPREAPMAVDMDGVPMGLQPSEEVKRAVPRQSPGAP
jgi:hypothetical protein